MFFIEDEGLMG